MFRKGLIVLTIIVLAFGLIGCSISNTNDQVNNSSDISKEYQKTASINQTVYPLTLKDGTGTEVVLESEPKRIISLIPSLTESLYAIGAGDKVVAVTIHDNYPEDIQQKSEIVFEDGLNPNIEQIINLDPDIIIMGAYNEELTAKIRSLNIPVAKYDPQNIDQIYDTIESLGKLTNSNEDAAIVINEMKTKEEKIIDKVAAIPEEERIRVWVEISSDLWTAGKGTFIDELITKAGGINIVDETGWIQYSEERVIEENPQAIITTYGKYDPNAVNNVLSREGWNNLDALINNRVINVNDDLVTRSGPRIIDGLEEFAKALYPDLFK